ADAPDPTYGGNHVSDDPTGSRPRRDESEQPRLRVTVEQTRRRDIIAERAMTSALAEATAERRTMSVADFQAAAAREGALEGIVPSLDLEDLGLRVRIEQDSIA